jgi:hypothetical protein
MSKWVMPRNITVNDLITKKVLDKEVSEMYNGSYAEWWKEESERYPLMTVGTFVHIQVKILDEMVKR